MTINLANALSRDGHHVDILVLKNRIFFKPDPEVNVKVFDIEKVFKMTVIGSLYEIIIRIISHFWKGAKLVLASVYSTPIFYSWVKRQEKKRGKPYDIIIARGYGSFENLGFVSDPRLIRVVVNSLLFENATYMKKLFFRLSFNKNKIVFNSYSVHEEFNDICEKLAVKPDSTRVIGNPTDVETILKLSNENIDVKKPYIINVGRLEIAKNHLLLVNAFALIADKIPHQLIIVGSGSYYSKVNERIKELGLTQRILLQGEVENPYPWMKNAELFVLSSKMEGLPNVVIESLVCHTPVVSVLGRGGTTELLKGKLEEYIAEPNAEDLSEKILFALHTKIEVSSNMYERYAMNNVSHEYLEYAIN